MSQSDITYFTRRAAESHTAKIAAVDGGARLAHKQLETAYAALSRSDERDKAAQPEIAESPSRGALFAWDNEGKVT
jgi:hypothetical protein